MITRAIVIRHAFPGAQSAHIRVRDPRIGILPLGACAAGSSRNHPEYSSGKNACRVGWYGTNSVEPDPDSRKPLSGARPNFMLKGKSRIIYMQSRYRP